MIGEGRQPRVLESVIAEQASRTFVGRRDELSRLLGALSESGPAVIYLHGVAGVGKSRLLSALAEHASDHGVSAIVVDCRTIEPTEQGFLRTFSARFGRSFGSIDEAVKALADADSNVVLALDHYELLRLLDSFLRQHFVPRLPRTVRLVIVDREAPSAAWMAAPGWQGLIEAIELDVLPGPDALSLLSSFGVPESRAARINRVVQGHPLALTLAASALANRQDSAIEDLAIHRVIHDLVQLYVAEIVDPLTRVALEAACALRRVTVSLLRAMLEEIRPQDAFSRLRSLPFVHVDLDGMHIHDSVKQVIASDLRATDPSTFREYQRAACSQLRAELADAPTADLWRYTADMLYLLDNPVIREAFFPAGARPYAVDPAVPQDGDIIRAICERNEGAEAAKSLRAWWQAAPDAFFVVRDGTSKVVGFYCLHPSANLPGEIRRSDPVASAWLDHLHSEPLAGNETALLLRRWLSENEGERPSPIQAACWLDIKRTYLALRPNLRRVYLVLSDFAPYASVAQALGFVPVPSANLCLDGQPYLSAMLDFGPSSVDGWLARLVAAELGVSLSGMLDVEARELVMDEGRVQLTRLEFAVFHYLREREGKAVGREELIRNVWGYKYDVGSNVVDAVINRLRKKLGRQSEVIQTVASYGYKFRHPGYSNS